MAGPFCYDAGMRIALATSAELPGLDIDDQRLLAALRDMGLAAEPVIWDDTSVDWSDYALCVIRSTWDYVPRCPDFVAWARHAGSRTGFWNPPELIAWNTDKTYLKDLESKGVSVVPTTWLTAGSRCDWRDFMRQSGWEEMVVKPVVSASGKDTHRIHPENLVAHQDELDRLLSKKDLMLQPYFKSVETTGELSFLFLNGEFSHAVSKHPAGSEFRVQEHLGGQFRTFQPSEEQLRYAHSVIQTLPWPTLYGRVDVMLDDAGRMCLGELELTEPSMYLSHGEGSAGRFAEAIAAKLGVSQPL